MPRPIYYMHTLDGKPASYTPGEQICLVDPLFSGTVILARSVEQIETERRASVAWRIEQRVTEPHENYGYLRVELPG